MIKLCDSLLLFVAAVSITITAVLGSDNVYFQHTPSYMQISSDIRDKYLKASQLPDVISAATGFTTTKSLNWEGLKAGNPLKRPKAVIVAEFDGFENLDLGLNYAKFPISVDVPPGWPFQVVADRIYKRFPEDDLTLLDITNDDSMYAVKSQYPELLESVSIEPRELTNDLLSDESVLNGRQLHSLNSTLTPDMGFLMDLQLFKEITDALRSSAKQLQTESVVDLVWFHSKTVQGLISMYGADSPQVKEAILIIRDILKQMENTLSKIYEDNFLMLVLTVDYQSENSKLRLARSLLQNPPEPTSAADSANIAETYSEDYPAIFNIIFFTMLIISLSIFAIALGMWHIDPGRDSIIYRMTSQRIKKDQ